MLYSLQKLAAAADRLTLSLCRLLLALLLVTVVANVLLRQGFSVGSLWLQDLAAYAFGMLAVFSLPCAMAADRHVRVDIFRTRQGAAIRNRIDGLALIAFLLPAWGLLVWLSLPLALDAMAGVEGSPQIGGLPGYFLVRLALPVAILLFCLQGADRLYGGKQHGAQAAS